MRTYFRKARTNLRLSSGLQKEIYLLFENMLCAAKFYSPNIFQD